MYAYVSILWVILTYGMETTFFRFSQSETDKTDVYSTSLLSLIFTSGVFLIISLIYAQPIAVWLGYPNNVNYVVWFVFILAFDAISAIPFAKLRQDNRPMKFAILKLINIGSNIGLNLFFILLCPFILKTYPDTNLASFVKSFFNPDDLVSYIFVSNLISTTLTLILQLPDFPWKKVLLQFSFMEKDAGLYVAVTCRFRSRLYQPFARQNPAGQVAPFGYRCNGASWNLWRLL